MPCKAVTLGVFFPTLSTAVYGYMAVDDLMPSQVIGVPTFFATCRTFGHLYELKISFDRAQVNITI